MKLKHLFLFAVLCATAVVQAQTMPPVPVDPDVRIGKLDNGLTYYIRHNNWPEHRANFYIAQKVGSIQEEESQRGLAHFLEHMAFNGSDNFKGNGLIDYLRGIGVEFGRDLNAYTSIDQTVYNIDNVPTTRQESLDSCLLILRDWSTGLTLDPEEIDKERGVIHEEWRLRTSASSRMFERNLPALYPGSKYGVRYPIGLMEVIDNFKPKELRDYYEKWYHPSNQGLIIVGDVDIDHTEEMIKKLFSGIKNPENALPIVNEPVPDTAEPIVIIDKDKEMTVSSVDIMFKTDPMPDEMKSSVAYLITKYALNAAVGMLNQRLAEAAQEPDMPFTSADAGYGNYIFSKTKDAFSLSAMPKDISQTAAALKAVMVEARKASEFGFTSTEYDRYKENYLSQLEKNYSNKDKRYNAQFYAQCRAHFLTNEPMPSIDFTYETMKQMVPMIPLEAINQLMGELLPKNDSNMVILNFNNEAEGNVYPTAEQLLQAVAEARSTQIQAFVDNVKNEPLLATLPKPGKIKKEVKDSKFGYTELYFSNGTSVQLMPTDYKKDQVLLDGEGPGAQSLYGEKDYANLQLFDEVIGISGLGNFSSTELEKALAGKIANANLKMGQKYMSVDGNSTPKDIETMLQMMYLYFTGINKDQKAYDNLMNQLEVALKNRDLTPEIALSDSLTATLYGHNPRMAPMTVDLLKKVDYDRILQIAKERTSTARDWTFRIVGNFNIDSIKPLVCRYIGGLPAKQKSVTSQQVNQMVSGQVENIFHRKQETPKATAYMIWHNEDMPYNLKNNICASIAGQVLSMIYLKKIREEASAAYTVGAQGSAMRLDDYHNVSLLAYCPMKPEKQDEAISILNAEVPALAGQCDPEMLQQVKEVMIKQFDDRVKTNSYWLQTLDTYKRYGIDTYTDWKSTLEKITPADIQNFMQEFLKADNKVTVIMLPEE